MMKNDKLSVLADIRQLVGTFLSRSEGNVVIGDDESLVVSGRLSSLQLVELAAALEEKYGIDFSDGFNQYDFDSINNMVALVGEIGE